MELFTRAQLCSMGIHSRLFVAETTYSGSARNGWVVTHSMGVICPFCLTVL